MPGGVNDGAPSVGDEMGSRLERFYTQLLFELEVHALGGGTAVGAGAVAKRVALAHGVECAEWMPVPRPTREERDSLNWRQVSR